MVGPILTGGVKRDCTCPRANHQHGTWLMYSKDKCRCDDCRKANREIHASYSRRKAYGRIPDLNLVPAGPSRERIQELRDQGHSIPAIARAAGLNIAIIRRIIYPLHGNMQPTVTARNQAKILNAKPGIRNMVPGARIDPTGFRRRYEALTWLGYTTEFMYTNLAVNAGNFHQSVHIASTITLARHRAMAALYDRYSGIPAPDTTAARKARNRARKRGYAPPLAWDDIDNPDEKPNLGGKTFKNESLPAEVEFLLNSGVAPDLIHQRVGYSTTSFLKRKLADLGRHDLSHRLVNEYVSEHMNRSRKNAA